MRQDDSGNRAKSIKLAVAVLLLISAGLLAYFQMGGSDAAHNAATRNFVDIATGEPFHYTLRDGDMEPIKAPSGGLTGYQAEACYWGKDSNGKWILLDKPTLVVLKNRIDPSTFEETFCPDCGRRVVGHNKKPKQDDIDRANGGSSESSSDEEDAENRDQ